MFKYFTAIIMTIVAIFAAGADKAPTETVQFSAEPDRPILTLTRVHGMVRDLEDSPLVRVFGDGRVLVNLPAYMKDAGAYEYQLDRSTLASLVNDLDKHGLMDFDVQNVSSQRTRQAERLRSQTGVRYMTLDSTITRFEINFASFARGARVATPLSQTIEWSDIAVEAERYPQLPQLQGLAAAERTLLLLIDHPQRRTVGARSGE